MSEEQPKLLNYRCMLDETETPVLVGKYGMIHAFGDRVYMVVFWSPQVAKKWGVELKRGEEVGILCSESKAKRIRKDLKTFRSMNDQSEMYTKACKGEIYE